MLFPVSTTASVDADVLAAAAALLGMATASAPAAAVSGIAAPAPSPVGLPFPSSAPSSAPSAALSSPRLAFSAQDNDDKANNAKRDGAPRNEAKVERSASPPPPSPFPWPVNDVFATDETRHEVLERMVAIAFRLLDRAATQAQRAVRRSPEAFEAALKEWLDAIKLVRFLAEEAAA